MEFGYFEKKNISSPLFLGTSQYPSLDILKAAIEISQTQVVTVSVRRQMNQGHTQSQIQTHNQNGFFDLLKSLPVHFLPNTAGCLSAQEAITTAQFARDIFQTSWIKLEVVGDTDTQAPNPFELVKACEELVKDGFDVFPYTTDDLCVAEALLNCGTNILMPWGAPIGSGLGLCNPHALKTMRLRFPEAKLILDAGLGLPSQATTIMEMGFDGILLNTAVAKAHDPVQMAHAFSLAAKAGNLCYQSGPMAINPMGQPSTPILGKPFHYE
jgi:thiazole synthase